MKNKIWLIKCSLVIEFIQKLNKSTEVIVQDNKAIVNALQYLSINVLNYMNYEFKLFVDRLGRWWTYYHTTTLNVTHSV